MERHILRTNVFHAATDSCSWAKKEVQVQEEAVVRFADGFRETGVLVPCFLVADGVSQNQPVEVSVGLSLP